MKIWILTFLALGTVRVHAGERDDELMAALRYNQAHLSRPSTPSALRTAVVATMLGPLASTGALAVAESFVESAEVLARTAKWRSFAINWSLGTAVVASAGGLVATWADSRIEAQLIARAKDNPRVWYESGEALAYFLRLDVDEQFAIASRDEEFTEYLIEAAEAHRFLAEGAAGA